ncbi:uncharacterized protein [Euphorbia lathyris]|uniref:uncharacterized protein n=1 Tax=Euphorbia lathyris TaxID=212925 RepID=UPI0033143E0B
MEGGSAGGRGSFPATKPSKFEVYQNPALSSALTANSRRPSKYVFLSVFSLSSASAFALLALISWENGLVETMRSSNLPQEAAYIFAKAIQTLTGLVFIASLFAVYKALTFYRGKNGACVSIKSLSKETKDQLFLTDRQILLLGTKPKVDSVATESTKKPPKSPYDILVPIHQPFTSSNRKSQFGYDKSNAGSGNKVTSFSNPSKSQSSPSSLYLVPRAGSPLLSTRSSPGSAVSSPWSSKRASSFKEIRTEEQLEQFLAEVDEQIIESARTHATPPPTLRGFGEVSPNTVASASGTKRSTPLRHVRMSPSYQKFTTSPKKGEGDFPLSMSVEASIEAFKHLGIYPQIEQWRDRLRQWFSSVLLNPLLNKIETSHIQVMQAAAKLGISITISQVGNDSQTSGTPATVSSIDRNEWQPALTLDEAGLLQQLRATLLQALDSSMPKLPAANLQQTYQQNPMIPMMKECVDAITEHERLHTLMKGEWLKGLLSHSNVPESYVVQRIRELAEGTCLKNYEYLGERKKKNWNLDLPTDSHLLLYLFCAFLEHPKWILHMDQSSYAGGQLSKNLLFLGALPQNERLLEKYISVISGVPSTLHPGACILAVGKQTPPTFALYWDKKLQFSLEGRTALWDSILLLCHRIKVGYGGVVRGMHLSSPALNILPVLDSEND